MTERVTRAQVKEILHSDVFTGAILDLCRDWLDMHERVAAAESALEHIHDVATDTSNFVSDMGIHVILTTCRDVLGIDATTAQDALTGAGEE